MALETVLLALKPTDDPELVIPTVIDLVGPAGATVVIGVVHTREQYETAAEDVDQPSPDELAERTTAVRETETLLEDGDVPYRVRGAVGDPGEMIVTLADEVGSDLLVVQGQRRSPTGKALFGSTAQHVLLNASCPVTFVRR